MKVLKVLNRQGYGWVEYVEQLPCEDLAAAQRFYQRAGMLLCLLYALRGTDCHHENLIASGEHLVLIDMETLMHHEARLMEDSSRATEAETLANQLFGDSVLRTGLLPRWDLTKITESPTMLAVWEALTPSKHPAMRRIGSLLIRMICT